MNPAHPTTVSEPGEVTVGAVVRDTTWGGRYTGTVVRREGRSVFVAWHDSVVEDELDLDQVRLVPDATAEQAAWRGGIGSVTPDGLRVEPVEGGER